MALLARLERAAFWSATKRSDPLSYRSNLVERILIHSERRVKLDVFAVNRSAAERDRKIIDEVSTSGPIAEAVLTIDWLKDVPSARSSERFLVVQ